MRCTVAQCPAHQAEVGSIVGAGLVSAGMGLRVALSRSSVYLKKQADVLAARASGRGDPIIADPEARSQVRGAQRAAPMRTRRFCMPSLSTAVATSKLSSLSSLFQL
jgi:hypothetical protein